MITPSEYKIATAAEAERVDYYVCALKSKATPFSDNLFANCARCQVAIQYRPYGPKRPKKICVRCALILEELGGAFP